MIADLSSAAFVALAHDARMTGYYLGLQGKGLKGTQYDYAFLRRCFAAFLVKQPNKLTAYDKAGLSDPFMDGWHDGSSEYVAAQKDFGPADWARR